MKYTFALLATLFTMAAFAQTPQPGKDRKIIVREDLISKGEAIWLQALQEHDPEFLYASKVWRFFFVDEKGNEQLFRNEVEFQYEDGFVVHQGKPTENVHYEVVFSEASQGGLFVTYHHSSGKDYTVDGTALINKDGVNQTTYSCGPSTCGFETKQDGAVLKGGKRKAIAQAR